MSRKQPPASASSEHHQPSWAARLRTVAAPLAAGAISTAGGLAIVEGTRALVRKFTADEASTKVAAFLGHATKSLFG